MANSVTALAARKKFAQAHGTTGTLPRVVKMAFGSGGVDENGPLPPSGVVDPIS